jgi:hypothetical protein
MTEESKLNELSSHQQRVVQVVHDDEMFRNLQLEMRKNARTGCGSHQVIQKLVKQVSKLEETLGAETRDCRIVKLTGDEEGQITMEEQRFQRENKVSSLPMKRSRDDSLRLRIRMPPCA